MPTKKVKTRKIDWDRFIDDRNVENFISLYEPNVWYETTAEEHCIVLEDVEHDYFVVKITDDLHGHFEIFTPMTYLSMNSHVMAVINREVAFICR